MKRGHQNQDQVFNKCLAENLGPSFKTLTANDTTKEEHRQIQNKNFGHMVSESHVLSLEDVSKRSKEDQQTLNVPNFVISNPEQPIQSHDMPTLFESSSSATTFAEQTDCQSLENKSVVSNMQKKPVSDRYDQNILTSLQSTNQDSTSSNFCPSEPQTMFGCYEEEVVDESNIAEEDLGFQLYLSSEDENDLPETDSVLQNDQHLTQKQQNVEEKQSGGQTTEADRQMPPEIQSMEETSKLTNRDPTEAQPDVIADESHVTQQYILEANKSSSNVQVFSDETVRIGEKRAVDNKSLSPPNFDEVNPVTPFNDGSDSSEVEIHKCHACGDEFRYREIVSRI